MEELTNCLLIIELLRAFESKYVNNSSNVIQHDDYGEYINYKEFYFDGSIYLIHIDDYKNVCSIIDIIKYSKEVIKDET